VTGAANERISSVSHGEARLVESRISSDQAGRSEASAEDPHANIAVFDFDGKVGGISYPSLSPSQQQNFKVDFFHELERLSEWALREHRLSLHATRLEVFVSDEYKISRALLPAAIGQRGRMEFPAWKVVAGEAAIMHELVHVYFGNGNRLLAEGLAVYLQATIGGNPAFPNFGRPLHEMACELLSKMVPEFAGGNIEALEKVRIADLDKIATPSPLRLRVGLHLYQADDFGQAHIYPLAGSFVEFLIAVYGTRKFLTLFMQTPLQPFQRNAGPSDRWAQIYGVPLSELETKWKSRLSQQSS
jgi:hypothetical protein